LMYLREREKRFTGWKDHLWITPRMTLVDYGL